MQFLIFHLTSIFQLYFNISSNILPHVKVRLNEVLEEKTKVMLNLLIPIAMVVKPWYIKHQGTQLYYNIKSSINRLFCTTHLLRVLSEVTSSACFRFKMILFAILIAALNLAESIDVNKPSF